MPPADAAAQATDRAPPPADARRLGPVRVRGLTAEAALGEVLAAVNARRPLLLAFCNAHTVNMASRDPAFAAALDGALVLNDGIGVEIGSRLTAGRGFPENLNGTDFTPRLLAALDRPTRVALVGSAPGVAAVAAQRLAARFPLIEIVEVQHGFFAPADAPALIERLRAADAALVLVGMGHPRQELWAADAVRSIDAVFCCIGAFLDFTAGAVGRAPAVVRRARMEWAYRLLLEPRRMARRYLIGNAAFLARMAAQRWRQRGSSPPP